MKHLFMFIVVGAITAACMYVGSSIYSSIKSNVYSPIPIERGIDTFQLNTKPFSVPVYILITKDTSFAPGSPVIVWLKKKDDEIMVHELLHVTHAVLSYSGIPLTDDTNEVYAYELGYLFKQYKQRK